MRSIKIRRETTGMPSWPHKMYLGKRSSINTVKGHKIFHDGARVENPCFPGFLSCILCNWSPTFLVNSLSNSSTSAEVCTLHSFTITVPFRLTQLYLLHIYNQCSSVHRLHNKESQFMLHH